VSPTTLRDRPPLPAAIAASLLLFVGSSFFGCIQNDGRRWTPVRGLQMPSIADEIELGLEFDQTLQEHIPIVHDPVIAGFLNDLGQEIVRGLQPQPLIYHFRLIEAPTLNAFAVPGGYIYFHSQTLLEAGSLGELAGVMGHEIAHVKARHYARQRQKTQVPGLLLSAASIGAAVASGEPGIALTGLAINQSLHLSYTREFETEADRLGVTYASKAGFEPTAIGRFLERVMAKGDRDGLGIPPYLFTHPQPEERIESLEIYAHDISFRQREHALLIDAFERAQARMAMLRARGMTSLVQRVAEYDPATGDAALARVGPLRESGALDAALVVLLEAAPQAPEDPRIPLAIGDILLDLGRFEGAAAAYRRTIELDSAHGYVFYRLGLAYKGIGDRQRAVYAFEQAELRLGPRAALRAHTRSEVEKLIFGVIAEAGFLAPDVPTRPLPPESASPRSYAFAEKEIRWWARLAPRFVEQIEALEVRFIAPSGRRFEPSRLEISDRVYAVAYLELGASTPPEVGTWEVEVGLDGDVAYRARVEMKR
jgi:predicted Zn-dependent protease